MPTVEHSTLSTTDLHEPKGISGQTIGKVYVTDGAGSGDWRPLPTGWGYYRDASAAQTITTTATKLSINGSGAETDTDYLPLQIRGTDHLWDTTNDYIKPVKVGDSYTVRIDLPITALTSSPTNLTLEVDIGGGASPSNVIVESDIDISKAAPYNVTFSFPVYVSTNFNTNGGQLFLSTDTGSVDIDDPSILIVKTSDGGI